MWAAVHLKPHPIPPVQTVLPKLGVLHQVSPCRAKAELGRPVEGPEPGGSPDRSHRRKEADSLVARSGSVEPKLERRGKACPRVIVYAGTLVRWRWLVALVMVMLFTLFTLDTPVRVSTV